MTGMALPSEMTKVSLSQKMRRLGFDPWLLLILLGLISYGLVMVYSASWDVSWRLHQDASALFRRQLNNLGLALAAMVVAARLPLSWLRKLALPVIVIAILALIAVLLVGGATADIPRRSFVGGSIQPSEFAKLALIIYLAVWMESKGDRLPKWSYGFWPLIMIIGIVGGLILAQPDLSAAITIGVVALAMFVLAGARFTQSLLITLGSAVVGVILVTVTTTGRVRFADYRAGLLDVEQASYHVQQSLKAFYEGGLFGQGLGAGRAKFGLLPAPHTDSIFAVIGEELGLMGALLVLILFCLFMWRGFRIAIESPNRLGMLLASGITFWIGAEALINMSVLLGMLPFAGNALPFFSFGGSSLVTTLTGVGFLLSVSRKRESDKSPGGEVALVGISGGDRRRRVSRPGRPRRAGRKG
jgi:cell division protein FtsW